MVQPLLLPGKAGIIPKCPAPNLPVQLQTVGLGVVGLGWSGGQTVMSLAGLCCQGWLWCRRGPGSRLCSHSCWGWGAGLSHSIPLAKASQWQGGIEVALWLGCWGRSCHVPKCVPRRLAWAAVLPGALPAAGASLGLFAFACYRAPEVCRSSPGPASSSTEPRRL